MEQRRVIPRGRLYYGWYVSGVAMAAMTVSYGLRHAFGLFIEPLRHEFGWSVAEVTFAFSISSLLLGLTSPASGWLLDRLGARWTMGGGAILAGACYLLAGALRTRWQFYLIYGVLLGALQSVLGQATAYPSAAKWFVRHRQRALALVGVGAGLANLLVPLIAMVLAAAGWRAAFWTSALLCFGLAPLLLGVLRRGPEELGLAPDGGPGTAPPVEPQLGYQQAATSRNYWLLAASFAGAGAATNLMFIYAVPFARSLGHATPVVAAAMAWIGAGTVVSRAALGLLGRAVHGARRALILAMALLLAGAAVLAAMRSASMFFAAGALIGVGFGLWGPASAALAADIIGRRSIGGAWGGVTFFASASSALLIWTAGALFDRTGSYLPVWIVTAGVFTGALLASVSIRSASWETRRPGPGG